jgi:phosphoglycerate dehydrogenase-like enzyme
MRHLQTFALVHPLTAAQLQVYAQAFPDVEFIASDAGLPAGIERAQGVAIHWAFPAMEELLAAARSMRWLHLRGAGIDRISVPRLIDSDIILTNGSGNHAPNIAEHVLAMMLGFARQLPALMRSQARGEWACPPAASIFELAGQSLLVVGLGAIGQEVARKAAALGMRVTGVRRSTGAEIVAGVDAVVTLDQLDAALPLADHVVIALPLTRATRGILSRERIGRMKPGAHLYNVGRGALVDHDALLQALRSGRLGGAGLDVTDPEPLPASSPLWQEPRALITAHSAGITPHSYERFEALLIDNLRRFRAGQPLLNVVDKREGY